MIVDLEKNGSLPPSHASVCIVGAGAAGISLAVELAQLRVNVILLESGGLRQEPETQALYNSEVSGHRHEGVHAGRFRVFGGSTTQWRGQIRELDPEVFDTRSWIPGSGWPFLKSELTPYYRRAVEIEGLSTALLDDASVWKALRVPEPDFGGAVTPYFTRWCLETDFTRIFGATLTDNPHITICLHANVSEIVLNGNGDAIARLRCDTLTGRNFTFSADSYVFCLGGIETARLLLQPIAGATCPPWNATGLVGRFFQDHIDATVAEVLPRNRRQLHRWFDNAYRGPVKYHPKLKLAAAEQKRLGCLSIGATFEFHGKGDESRREFCDAARYLKRGILGLGRAARLVRRLPDAGLLVRQAIRFKLQGRAFNQDDAGIFLHVHCEQAPNTESRITLTSDRDVLGMFRCRLDWRVSDLEIATIRHFIATLGEAFKHDFADVTPFPDLEQGGPGLLARLGDNYHHMGATRMACSSRDGVVDPNLRLFGTRNGYVCSSSVFPASGFSNPTHTIVALAVRLAEHLAAQVSTGAEASSDQPVRVAVPHPAPAMAD
jgi:choline dehydrogenase-like flavoprotein